MLRVYSLEMWWCIFAALNGVLLQFWFRVEGLGGSRVRA